MSERVENKETNLLKQKIQELEDELRIVKNRSDIYMEVITRILRMITDMKKNIKKTRQEKKPWI